uniref:Uncharacterized protein LOC103430225 n=1 Tax=Rhizophora mucronata TaxID=61149 RepID=A0A2P2NRE3_RHIMU
MYRSVRRAPCGIGANLARFEPNHMATNTRTTKLLLAFPQTQLVN